MGVPGRESLILKTEGRSAVRNPADVISKNRWPLAHLSLHGVA